MLGIIGWLFIALSGAVLVLTFPPPAGGGSVLAPGLIPIFGAVFGVIYSHVQFVVVLKLKSRRGMILTPVFLALGMLVAWFGRAMDPFGTFDRLGISYARQIFCGGACASGVALGIAIIRGYVAKGR